MSAEASVEDRARQEAADWFARLNSRTITTDALREFRDWRADPDHARAYAELEALWKAAGKLNADPDIQALTEAALRTGRGRRFGLPRGPASIVIVAALAGGALLLTAGLIAAASGRTYTSGLGEQRIVRLDDGSRVRLDTDTKLTVRFDKQGRHIVLARGQAFFEVAHDVRRPFTVRADGAEVRALGTRFDVRRDAGLVRVTLVEGKVAVRGPQGQAWTLTPGQQLKVTQRPSPSPTPTAPVRIDVAAATSWTTGRLTFQATPLSAAIAEVNRYGPDKIVLDADRLSQRPVSGAFDAGDSQAFAQAVAELCDLQVSQSPKGEIRLHD